MIIFAPLFHIGYSKRENFLKYKFMKKHVLFLMMLFSVFAVRVNAQDLGDYDFSTGVDATKWITLTSPTTLISSTGDGVASTVQNIGFTFNFAGTNYPQ